MNRILPIGSIVQLKNGEVKLMILNRFPLYNNNGEIGYFDYLYDKYGDEVVEFAGDVWDGTKKVVGETMKSVGDTADKIWDSAGDAVTGFFSGLGSVFN